MINKTTQPLLINPNIAASELDMAIREALRYTVESESKYLSSGSSSTVLRRDSHVPTFAFFFSDLPLNHQYGEEFLRAAFSICQLSNLKSLSTLPRLDSVLVHRPKIKSTRNYLEPIRGGFRPFFVHLWSKSILTLPLTFTVERSLRKQHYRELLTEVAAYFYFYDVKNRQTPQNHPSLGSWNDSGFNSLHRIIWATNWHHFEDANLEEISDLHTFLISKPPEFPNTTFDIRPMLREMFSKHSDRVNFTAEEISLYDTWIRGRNFQQFSYEYFRENHESIKVERKNNYARSNSEAARKRYADKIKNWETRGLSDYTKPLIITFLENIAVKADHDAALEYFTHLSALKRGFASIQLYPGRTHIDFANLNHLWQRTFQGWLQFRATLGLESDDGQRVDLSVLCDYLFCYLPWWKELYPHSKIEIPLSPIDFDRFIFLVPNGKGIEESPLPFLEILKLRRNDVSGRGSVVSTLFNYFEYLISYANLYPEFVGQLIKNPVSKLDYPRGRNLHSKTSKNPISKSIMPYLLRYCYAIEMFGMYLQGEALAGRPLLTRLAQQPSLNPDDFGYSLTIEFNGEIIPISNVPNIFSVVKRTIRKDDGQIISVEIPHLGTMRLYIAILETGLRGQSIQWLDRRKWDLFNAGKPTGQYMYDLYVNTDKSKDRAWIAPITYRVRELLLREQQFQESIEEEGMNDLIPYEGRPNSRFDDVLPLFRASRRDPKPINDSWYHATWPELLVGFEIFYNDNVVREGYTHFVKIGPSWVRGLEGGVIRICKTLQGWEYCPLRYSALHTPHSARATFISNRAGIIELEDIRLAVGHANELITSYYVVEKHEQIAAKLQAADDELWNFDPNNPVHIRADQENSTLKRSFKRDRVDTEQRFGFVSVSLLNENDDDFLDGVDLLRTTSMTQVVFRETHICPVGESCPENIKDLIYEPRRCGLCPIAVKSVDHMPAITAKMRQLLEQIQCSTLLLEKLEKRGEPSAVLDEINERRKIDTLEYLGWCRALQAVSQILDTTTKDALTTYHVDEPEIVKRHLKLIAKKTPPVEFILERIIDSEAYPSMQTPELRAKANILRQRLLANVGLVEEALEEVSEGDEIKGLLSSLKVVMDAYGVNIQTLLHERWLDVKHQQRLMKHPKRLSQGTPSIKSSQLKSINE